MEQSATETVEIFRQLLETVVSTLTGINTDGKWSSDILDVLNGLREVYEACATDIDHIFFVPYEEYTIYATDQVTTVS